MFIGHLAVGFAAKRFAPRTSLGWLLVAPMFLDLIWPVSATKAVSRAGQSSVLGVSDASGIPVREGGA